jgi:hypothetical protein
MTMAGKNPFAKMMSKAKAPLDYAKGKVPVAAGRKKLGLKKARGK